MATFIKIACIVKLTFCAIYFPSQKRNGIYKKLCDINLDSQGRLYRRKHDIVNKP